MTEASSNEDHRFLTGKIGKGTEGNKYYTEICRTFLNIRFKKNL